jgi:hypothetical protein
VISQPRVRRHLLPILALFATAFLVRLWLRSGLILGDDAQEFGVLQHVLSNGPDLRDQLQVRFGGWVLHYVVAMLLGVSETTLLLPSFILSSSSAVLAYLLLVRWGYDRLRAILGGLIVATAPFEVVLGTCRTNDLVLGATLAFGFTALVLLEERPVWQGIVIALALWFGFYVKLWAVYVLPGLGLYGLIGRRWRAMFAFTMTSLLVHGATLYYWKSRLGTFTPFIDVHAANYPVAAKDLLLEWSRYPHMIFIGSEFQTTLFGVVPWLLVALLVWRMAWLRLDRADGLLLSFWGSLFLLMEFFPNAFVFDRYYSVPRIFRYLAPLSFPIALHTAKLVLDVTRRWRPAWMVATVGVLVAVNLGGAMEGTLPGRIHREALFKVIHAIEQMAPPRVVAEITLGYWLERLYLDPYVIETAVETPPEIYEPRACEKWVRDKEARWPTGTLLLTGLGNYVHYGAHTQSLRLAWFDRPLDDRWELVGEYGDLSYLPRPEVARLWRLTRGTTASAPPHEPDDPPPPDVLPAPNRLVAGRMLFEAGKHREARAHLRVLMDAGGPEAEDATFYYAASFFRQDAWVRTSREFKHLLGRFPRGRWVAAAHWHIAICDLRRGRVRRARERFTYIIRRFANDPATVANSRAELRRLERRHQGLLVQLWRQMLGRSS